MDNSIIFVREYKIEGRDKTIPAGAVYDYVESESKYVPRTLDCLTCTGTSSWGRVAITRWK